MMNFLFHLHAGVSFGPSVPPSCSLRLSCPVYLSQPAIVFIALQKKISTHTGAMGCGISPGDSVQQDKPVLVGGGSRGVGVHSPAAA